MPSIFDMTLVIQIIKGKDILRHQKFNKNISQCKKLKLNYF
jgi:hypothetical protein